ncbi:MAG TPA: ester cyclase [Thermoleophilaceae bacterium]|nr:ester cyclase [Thermoleophilaceae bacterium]
MAQATKISETPAKQPAKPRRSARVKAVEEVARGYFAAIASRDPQAVVAFFRSDGIDDIVPVGVFRGPAEVRGFFAELFAAVPDLETTVTRVVADHDAAGVEWRMAGTFDGAVFQGIEPTGGHVELRGFDLLEIDEDGKITSNTGYYDGAELARQIGMLPSQDSGADRAMRTGFNALTKLRQQIASARG